MVLRLHREVDKVKSHLLVLCSNVEKQVEKAVSAVINRDVDLANAVIENDENIDQAEVKMEEQLLLLLTLYQPVAIDLRFVVAILKINNDLERIGDLAVNMAKRVKFIQKSNSSINLDNIQLMSEKAMYMLEQSLQALIRMDQDIAYAVCDADDEVDDLNRAMYDILKNKIRKKPDEMNIYIDLISISRFLERIADLATNISEDVIYICNGKIVRHRLGG
jgi:phosphate transport system protein